MMASGSRLSFIACPPWIPNADGSTETRGSSRRRGRLEGDQPVVHFDQRSFNDQTRWRWVALNATIAAMEFKVLGPLEVIGPRGRIKIGSGLQRAILALLVLNVGETVSTDHLIDEVWGDDPPASAQHAIGVHVSRLRR